MNQLEANWNDVVDTEAAKIRLVYVNIPYTEFFDDIVFTGVEKIIEPESKAVGEYARLWVRGNSFSMHFPVIQSNQMMEFRAAPESTATTVILKEAFYKDENYEEPCFGYQLKILADETTLDDVEGITTGDLFFSDSTWAPLSIPGKTCVGMVFKTGLGSDDKVSNYSYSDKSAQIKGYVVALQDATTEKVKFSPTSAVMFGSVVSEKY